MSLHTVWVTGSSRGIGKAIAELFARNGFRVVLHCLERTDLLNRTVDLLKSENCSVMSTVGDISSEQDVDRMYAEIKEVFGPVDILINNAGIALQEQLLTDCRDVAAPREAERAGPGAPGCPVPPRRRNRSRRSPPPTARKPTL